ncbi:MAG TPA: cell division protein FtsQ/DivIB [Bacteroidales bacterium]|nr:cell division protein FtsQ/DivIB [Bacteroidales bacterium]
MKIAGRILILLSSSYLVIIPAFLTHRTNGMTCTGISINIADSSDFHLVNKLEIRNLVSSGGARVIGAPVNSISLGSIEERLSRLRELKEAEAYFSIDGTLHVYANQRNPILRIIAGGGDYFLDDEGVVLHRKKLYTPRLHILEGNIRITSQMLNGVSVLDTAIKNSILPDIYELVQYIRHDNFWSAQIDQINVDDEDEIDLIPRMGDHRIHLGTIGNYRGKLRNLEVFYRDVMPVTGWNRYDLIDLEFESQIVCRKR